MSKTPQELGMDYDERCDQHAWECGPRPSTIGFITVWSGAYATVRAHEEANRQFGAGNYRLAGISEIKNNRYIYRVIRPTI